MATKIKAGVEDLYHVPENGKAELINGEIILMPPTGDEPARAAGKIYISLYELEKREKTGRAYPDNVGFVINLPHRKSISPDASFYIGKRAGMKFLEGAPVFAVEVRSENDYGPEAEKAMAAKRADYFASGALTVWDVDLLSDNVIRVYRNNDPDNPAAVYQRGGTAEAEPALPGWRFAVDELFQ